MTQWVNAETKDGAVLREYTNRAACKRCITTLQDGQAPDQPSLLDEIKGVLGELMESPAYISQQEYNSGYKAGWRRDELLLEGSQTFMSGYEHGQTDKQEYERDRGDSSSSPSEEVPGALPEG